MRGRAVKQRAHSNCLFSPFKRLNNPPTHPKGAAPPAARHRNDVRRRRAARDVDVDLDVAISHVEGRRQLAPHDDGRLPDGPPQRPAAALDARHHLERRGALRGSRRRREEARGGAVKGARRGGGAGRRAPAVGAKDEHHVQRAGGAATASPIAAIAATSGASGGPRHREVDDPQEGAGAAPDAAEVPVVFAVAGSGKGRWGQRLRLSLNGKSERRME